MKNVILIAPPAAGKGTLSKILCNNLGYISLSTGDLLREKAQKDLVLQEKMKSGKLISDETVFNALEEKLSELKDTTYILDGFPRTIEQAIMYKNLISNMNKKIGIVIYLDVPKEELIKRITTRLSCPKCKKPYSTINDKLKPKEEGICDTCKEKLIKREDDTALAFEQRYDEYLKKTSPLINYYEQEGLLCKIKAIDTDETYNEAISFIKMED